MGILREGGVGMVVLVVGSGASITFKLVTKKKPDKQAKQTARR